MGGLTEIYFKLCVTLPVRLRLGEAEVVECHTSQSVLAYTARPYLEQINNTQAKILFSRQLSLSLIDIKIDEALPGQINNFYRVE